MLCVTHDDSLAERIKSADQSWSEFCQYHPIDNQNARKAATRSLKELDSGGRGGQISLVVISHPHGRPKKVSVGRLVSGAQDSSFNYSTPTCPGSSGAPLFLVDSERLCPGFFPWFGCVHSGTFPNPEARAKTKKYVNFSNNFVFHL